MAKYNYDKKVLSGLGVGPFLNEVKTREAEIAKAPSTMPKSIYNANVIAEKLHPSYQIGVITEIKEHKDTKTYVIEPDGENGFIELAYFRAGQYISVELNIGDTKLCKPYSLSCSPKAAFGEEDNRYEITVKKTANGFASDYILSNWKVEDKVVMSAPLGNFYYVGLRDAKNVVALAGGSGITPFISMAKAVKDGIEEFNLTIIYGSKTKDEILFKDELDKIVAESNGKVKVVHVLSDEMAEGYEHGFITADIIKKYAVADDYSLYVCGPKAMYTFAGKEIAKLNLPKRRIRFEVSGEYGDPSNDEAFPKDAIGKKFNVKVLVRGEEYTTQCSSTQSLISAIEAKGIRVPSDCRSGECGWCHSRLVSGDVYVPEKADGRRAADKKFGWIHPCVSYPLSDIEIEVFPMLE